ncbi:MAG TPA: hypothetical protein VG944_21145 [Fimbriimonas sp.]|nr:hypothetical protein [Fimbriimonas sp.]
MHTKGPKEDPLVELGYEYRDINYRGLGWATVFFVGFATFSFLVVGAWFFMSKPKIGSHLSANKPLPTIGLQSDIGVREDIQAFRQKETDRLNSSGQNPDGTYHIPVDHAMELIVDRGLPHVRTEVKVVSPGNTIKQNALQPGTHAPQAQPIVPVPLGGAVSGQ